MSLHSYRKDLKDIENIIEALDETGLDEIYLDNELEIDILNGLLNKIRLNVRDILSVKELAGINSK